MAQILACSLSKRLYKRKKLRKPRGLEVTMTPEEAKEFKGRIPTGVRDQVLYLNEKAREQKREEKRELLRKDKNNAIVQTQKLDAFLEEFLRNGGNATDAAMKVFDVSSRASASSIGSVYLKKAKTLGRVYLEQHGYTFGRLLTTAAQKAEQSRLPDWWDRVMGIAGYDNPGASTKGFAPQTTNVNIIQSEKELFKKYMNESTEGEILADSVSLKEGIEDDNKLP